MIKFEIPANRPDIARALGRALLEIAGAVPGAKWPAVPEVQGAEVIDDSTVGRSAPSLASDDQFFDPQDPPAAQEDEDEGNAAAAFGGRPTHDNKGVAFDPAYCADAKDPFYATGKQAGQWKRRKGVAEDRYDAWYASQLHGSRPGQPDADEPQVNVTAAFGGGHYQPPAAASPVPETAGKLMAWFGELTVAGRITQDVVNAAYRDCDVRVQDLFPPTPEAAIRAHVASLHAYVSGRLND